MVADAGKRTHMTTKTSINLRQFAAASIFAAGAALWASSASAQAITYTEAQATAGAAAFGAACARCHGAQAQGAEAPPLVGAQFAGSWRDGPVSSLFDFISTLMPEDKPGSLSKDAYVSIVAHLLKLNGIPAGAAPLPIPPPEGMKIPK